MEPLMQRIQRRFDIFYEEEKQRRGGKMTDLTDEDIDRIVDEAIADTVKDPKVIVLESEYNKLLERSEWLMYLEHAGVDNWEGYGYAQDLREKAESEKDTE